MIADQFCASSYFLKWRDMPSSQPSVLILTKLKNFQIPHDTLPLLPKFCRSYFLQMFLGKWGTPRSIWKQLKNRELVFKAWCQVDQHSTASLRVSCGESVSWNNNTFAFLILFCRAFTVTRFKAKRNISTLERQDHLKDSRTSWGRCQTNRKNEMAFKSFHHREEKHPHDTNQRYFPRKSDLSTYMYCATIIHKVTNYSLILSVISPTSLRSTMRSTRASLLSHCTLAFKANPMET